MYSEWMKDSRTFMITNFQSLRLGFFHALSFVKGNGPWLLLSLADICWRSVRYTVATLGQKPLTCKNWFKVALVIFHNAKSCNSRADKKVGRWMGAQANKQANQKNKQTRQKKQTHFASCATGTIRSMCRNCRLFDESFKASGSGTSDALVKL